MAADTPSPDSLARILLEFLEQRRESPTLSVDEFLSKRPSSDSRLRPLIEEAQGWTDAEIQSRFAEFSPRTASVGHGSSGAEDTQEIERTLAVPGEARQPNGMIDNRYRVARVLGEGGFGKVYLVEDDLYSNEKRALKVILPRHSAEPAFERRFKNEIIILRGLSHPGIPQIFNDGKTARGEFYYTMAFVPGVTLADVLKKSGPLPPLRIVGIVRQLLSILDYAHQKGVVHRDLKPANIMLVDAGAKGEQVKVLDFGIAKVMQQDQGGDLEAVETMQTMAGMGTPHYMSPEQIRGKDVDGKSDIYALGIIIYQMCSGLLPFAGKTAMEIATARLEQTPKRLETKDTPEWLKELVMKLLERNKERRPQTKEIFAQFDKLSQGHHELRRSMLWLSAGVFVVAVGVAWMLWRSGEDQNRARPNPALVGPTPSPAPELIPAIQLDAPKSDEQMNSRTIQFTGRAQGRTSFQLAIQHSDGSSASKKSVRVDSQGSFSERVPLEAGRWHLTALDDATPRQVLLDRYVVIDLDGPELQFDALTGGSLGGGESAEPALVAEQKVDLKGSARDKEPGALDSLTIDNKPVTVDEAGRFHHEINLSGHGVNTITAVARDQAGNVTKVDLKILWAPNKPEVIITNPVSLAANARPDENFEVRGRVNGAPCKKLLVGDKDITQVVGRDGTFSYGVTITSPGLELEFKAMDALERWSDVKVSIKAQALSPGPGPSGRQSTDKTPNGCDAVPGFPLDAPTGLPTVVNHRRSGITLVLLPTGQLQRKDGPIDLRQPIYVGKFEVTNEQFARSVKTSSSEASGASGMRNKPKTNVSFQEALEFCEWAERLRLPTREEWIYAASGGKDQDYPWGYTFVAGGCVSRVGDKNGVLADVGSTPNDMSAFGVYDMAGNVSEWCTEGAAKPGISGGSLSSDPRECRIGAKHFVIGAAAGQDSVGFRVVLEP